MAKFCPICGTENTQNNKFCGSCGYEVDKPVTNEEIVILDDESIDEFDDYYDEFDDDSVNINEGSVPSSNNNQQSNNVGFLTYTGNDIPRTAEIVLSILGGVFGLIGGLFAIGLAGMSEVFGVSSGGIDILGFLAIIWSIIGIISGVLVRNNPKLYGLILIVMSILLLISISLYGALGMILLLIAGILALVRK